MTKIGEGSLVKPSGNALTDIATGREVAEVQSSMIIAKKFPRNQTEAIDRIMIACQRPGLAEGALYSYARGGTDITGPSIRLAEAMAQNWGNITFGIRELEQRTGESTVEAFAWDMETNTRQVKAFQVPHKRHTRKGSYKLEDPRDIYEMVANQGARRLRACILGIIPSDVVEMAQKQCEETLRAKADCTPEAIKKMLEAFEKYGVTKEMIEKRIQRKLESITPAQKMSLGKIYNSLKDNMSGIADWFEVEEAPAGTTAKAKGNAAVKDKLKDKKEPKSTTKKQETKEPEVETAPLYDEEKCGPCLNRDLNGKLCVRLSDPDQIEECQGVYPEPGAEG